MSLEIPVQPALGNGNCKVAMGMYLDAYFDRDTFNHGRHLVILL